MPPTLVLLAGLQVLPRLTYLEPVVRIGRAPARTSRSSFISPLTIQSCEPLPGPTPAKSSPVATVVGLPVWNCEMALTVHPPSSLPDSADLSLKNGNW